MKVDNNQADRINVRNSCVRSEHRGIIFHISALVQRLPNINYTIVNTIMPGKIVKTAGQ